MGCVVDRNGAGIKNLEVDVLITNADWTIAAHGDSRSCFRFEKAISGEYTLQLRAPGFQPIVRHMSQAARLDDFGQIHLEVAPIEGPTEVVLDSSPTPGALPGTGSVSDSNGPFRTSSVWQAEHIVAPSRYPVLASQAQIQGTVEVVCTLSEDGRVLRAEASTGHPVLRAAAEENAKQWRFRQLKQVPEGVLRVPLIYSFELTGPPVRGILKTEFSFDAPNRIRLVSERPCADHAPCTADKIRNDAERSPRR